MTLHRALPLVLLLVATASPAAEPGTWHFLVSGDSRDCGDVVMPAMAEAAKRQHPAFFWYLGDLRNIHIQDHDITAAMTRSAYLRGAWPDAIEHQLSAFRPVPIYIALGDHDLIAPKTRAEYIKQFRPWLDQKSIAQQREADAPGDHEPKTYYHWRAGNVDFITLDNASVDMLDDAQLRWFEATLERDAANQTIRSVVVGGHMALPHGFNCTHSMNSGPHLDETGKRVYHDLLRFREQTKKPVYVLASHSHFALENVYDTPYWHANGGILPGWVVGTAGAERYRLPPTLPGNAFARTDIYGYLVATVHPDGTMEFAFHEVTNSDVPASVLRKIGAEMVNQCFAENKNLTPSPADPCPEPSKYTPAPRKQAELTCNAW